MGRCAASPPLTEDNHSEYQPIPVQVAMPWTPPVTQGEFTYQYDDIPLETTEGYYQDATAFNAQQLETPVIDQQHFDHAAYRTPPQPIINGGIQTRSGRSLMLLSSQREDTPATQYTSASAASASKKRTVRKNKKGRSNSFHLDKPLSQMVEDYDVTTDQVTSNIKAHINRSPDDRQAEAKKRKDGKTPRPMNSFMLYRMAYKQVIQAWGKSENNNQFISQVAGRSWNMETEDVKKSFEEYAITERNNHQSAFPTYKFAPNKTPKKRGRDDDDEGDFDTDIESNYSGVGRRKRPNTRYASEIPRSVTSTPDPGALYYSPPVYQQEWQPNGGLMMPQFDMYGRPLQHMQYNTSVSQPYYPMPNFQQPPPMSIPQGYMGMPQQYQYPISASYVMPQQNPFGIDPNLDDFGRGNTYEYGTTIENPAQYDIPQVFAAQEPVLHPGEQMFGGPVAGWSDAAVTRNAFDDELDTFQQ